MRFLTDQDVYAITIRFLCSLGHDVVTAAQLSSVGPKPTTLNCYGSPKLRVVSSSLATAISVGLSSFWAVAQGSSIYAFCPRPRMLCTLNSSGS